MNQYFAIALCLSIMYQIQGSDTIIAPYEETIRYAYWQPVNLETIEKQLNEMSRLDTLADELREKNKHWSWSYKKNNTEIKLLESQANAIEEQVFKEAIAYLMRQRDEQILNNPIHLMNKQHKTPLIEHITSGESEEDDWVETEIHSGPYYETFKKIKSYYPQFADVDILLKKRTFKNQNTSGTLGVNGIDKSTGKHTVILYPSFYKSSCDANKIHTILHELNHILYSDSNHSFLTNCRKTNELKNMTTIPWLQKMINFNAKIVTDNISRYVEWRCDTQAMLAMQCPYCMLEIAAETLNDQECSRTPGMYYHKGYLMSWQFSLYIEQLYKKETMCKYHVENDLNLDALGKHLEYDGSSLAQRLEIIKNHPTPTNKQFNVRIKRINNQ